MLKSSPLLLMSLMLLGGCNSEQHVAKSVISDSVQTHKFFDLSCRINGEAVSLKIVNKSDQSLIFSTSYLGLEAVATLTDGDKVWLSRNPNNEDSAIPFEHLCIVPPSSSLAWSISLGGRVGSNRKINTVSIKILRIRAGNLTERLQSVYETASPKMHAVEASLQLVVK